MNEYGADDAARRWRAKVAAWVHDPVEKALILMRGIGHEEGTVARLRELLFGCPKPDADCEPLVRQADRWASAADRLDFPRPRSGSADWGEVRFVDEPVLVHPLSGEQYDLRSLQEIDTEPIQQLSFDHLQQLIVRAADGSVDWRRTFLAFWRFGPELLAPEIQSLWRLLPADTRSPDHSIFDHLRLCSAFAGALAAGRTPALLSVSLGPVQPFIASGRSTSDLWAGSHLLSRLSWEAMRVICERCGPDAILLPDLHGVPLVDLWISEELAGCAIAGLVRDQFARADWQRLRSDANPLFVAALPNRFVALVAEQELSEVVAEIRKRLQGWVRAQAECAWDRICETCELQDAHAHGRRQIEQQLAGFPEIHWAAAPWSLVGSTQDDGLAAGTQLERALAAFYPHGHGRPGLFGGAHLELIRRHSVDNPQAWFVFHPNPGICYPSLHELVERSLAAAKTTRTFDSEPQHGFRCTLCGEREWLTTDRGQLQQHAPAGSVWERLAGRRPAWARAGERLCALCALRRLWPTLFVEEVQQRVPNLEGGLSRFVVSTHTMALAPCFRRLTQPSAQPGQPHATSRRELLGELHAEAQKAQGWAALPRGLERELSRTGDSQLRELCHGLPARLDELRETARAADRQSRSAEAELRKIERALRELTGERPETYYALVLMDGDRMGAWLSGSPPCERPRYRDLWHPKLAAQVDKLWIDLQTENDPAHHVIEQLCEAHPWPSPAYHAAISRALNGFSLELARRVVEEVHLGKLLYAGGDDLLAMAAVEDLLPLVLTLRCAYSGTFSTRDPEQAWELLRAWRRGIKLGRGHAWIERTDPQQPGMLLRLMGRRATASIGAVVAHHMAPLGRVLAELRRAERRAKELGGRDALSITLIKRAGSTEHLTCKWGLENQAEQLGASPIGVLLRLREALAHDLSRRASYVVLEWLAGLPDAPVSGDPLGLDTAQYEAMLEHNLRRQLLRQRLRTEAAVPSAGAAAEREQRLQELARDLARLAMRQAPQGPARFLERVFTVIEFLARGTRMD